MRRQSWQTSFALRILVRAGSRPRAAVRAADFLLPHVRGRSRISFRTVQNQYAVNGNPCGTPYLRRVCKRCSFARAAKQ